MPVMTSISNFFSLLNILSYVAYNVFGPIQLKIETSIRKIEKKIVCYDAFCMFLDDDAVSKHYLIVLCVFLNTLEEKLINVIKHEFIHTQEKIYQKNL